MDKKLLALLFILHFVSMLETYCKGNGFKFIFNLGMVGWIQQQHNRGYLSVIVPTGLFILIITFFF